MPAKTPTLAGGHETVAVCGISVHEGVGRGVIGLTWVAEGSGHGGEAHEEVEVQVLGRPIQVYQARNPRGEHLSHLLCRFLADGVVANDASRVDDAVQAAELALDVPNQSGHSLTIGHTHLAVDNAHSGWCGVIQEGERHILTPRRTSHEDQVHLDGSSRDVTGYQPSQAGQDGVVTAGDSAGLIPVSCW